jgi:hypothetical protein
VTPLRPRCQPRVPSIETDQRQTGRSDVVAVDFAV